MWKKGYVGMRFDEWRREMWERELANHPGGEEELLARANSENATLGYVTKDVSFSLFSSLCFSLYT